MGAGDTKKEEHRTELTGDTGEIPQRMERYSQYSDSVKDFARRTLEYHTRSAMRGRRAIR